MHNQGIIVFTAPLMLQVQIIIQLGRPWLRWPREGLLLKVVKHFISVLIDYAEMVVRTNWSQWRDRLQVRIGIQPVRVLRLLLRRPLSHHGHRLRPLWLILVETRIRLLVMMIMRLLTGRLAIRIEAEQVNYVT